MAKNGLLLPAATLSPPQTGTSRLTWLRRAYIRWFQLALRVTFAVGVATVIIGSLLPADHVPAIANDKLEHFLAYALLGLLGSSMFQTRRSTLLLALALSMLAMVLELAQNFSPGRSTEVADALMSAFGAFLMPTLLILASLRSN